MYLLNPIVGVEEVLTQNIRFLFLAVLFDPFHELDDSIVGDLREVLESILPWRHAAEEVAGHLDALRTLILNVVVVE